MTYEIGSIFPEKLGGFEWRVLDMQDDKVLLLSEYVLEMRAFHKDHERVTWEKCTLRQYLNSEFLQKFSPEDMSRIAETNVSNFGNIWYWTKDQNDTTDKVFLLSLEEVDRYFGNSGDYINQRKKEFYEGKDDSEGEYIMNTHNETRKAYDIGNRDSDCCWWLRTSGAFTYCAASVLYCGGIYVLGGKVSDTYDTGVRPALWLNLLR